MSYMKQLWIKQEEARAEAAMDSIRDKQSWAGMIRTYYNICEAYRAGNVVAARSAPLASLPTGVDAGTVWACIIEIDLYKKCSPTCCRCGRTDWGGFSFRENKKVSKVTDVERALVQCLHMGCGWRGELQSVIHPTERPSLYTDVKNWLQVTPQRGLKAIMEGAGQEEVESFCEDEWDSNFESIFGDPCEHVPPETRVPKPTCEADKPEGTRDVDKFLKEQQEKLWREE